MTKDITKQDSWVIKLSGKAELPKPLKISHNFKLEISGSITAITEQDNDDGSRTYYYKFEPVLVEGIDEKGERIKAKDVRKTSQRMRSRSWLYWKENNVNMSDDDFWNWFGSGVIRNFDEIVDLLEKQ